MWVVFLSFSVLGIESALNIVLPPYQFDKQWKRLESISFRIVSVSASRMMEHTRLDGVLLCASNSTIKCDG